MEHVHATKLLVVIALFQLSQAELSGWYSANVINDGEFSPKPISEIFTTEPPTSFSPKNPIVVLQPSTTKSPFSISTSDPTAMTSPSPSTTMMQQYSSSTPSSIPTEVTFETQPTQQPSTFPPYFSQSTTDPQPSSFSISPNPTITFPQSESFEQRQPSPVQVIQAPSGPQQSLPNYIVIYQQAPQTVQNFPPSASQQNTPVPQTISSTSPPQSSTFALSSPQSTFSTTQSEPQTIPSSFSTFKSEMSTQTTLSTFQPSSASTFPNWPTPSYSSTMAPFGNKAPCDNPTIQPFPKNVSPFTDNKPKFPTLRIRMVAPSGSITNINVNPTAATTTKRPTTTRRATTTRTRRTKRNKNNYDGCVNTCDGRRSPICATPLSVSPIDPNTLKGFPSICHMACHNSFRKNQYEMLVEGRCGRLRTRIRTFDSKSKLKRDDLNKAQYTIVGNDPQTVFEFQSLPR